MYTQLTPALVRETPTIRFLRPEDLCLLGNGDRLELEYLHKSFCSRERTHELFREVSLFFHLPNRDLCANLSRPQSSQPEHHLLPLLLRRLRALCFSRFPSATPMLSSSYSSISPPSSRRRLMSSLVYHQIHWWQD
jgi:hypothetical protein